MVNLARTTLSAFLAYFAISGMLSTIGIVSGPMAQHFATSVTDITNGFGWLTFGLLIGAALAVVVVERFPLRLLQASMFFLIACALLLLQRTQQLLFVWPLLGVVGVALGIGLAAAALTIARSYLQERRASMLVITDACFSVAGSVCVALTLYFYSQGLGWATGYLVVALVAVAVVGLALTSEFPATQEASAEAAIPESAVPAQRPGRWTPELWVCLGVLCLYTLGQQSMLWWLPQHLQQTYGAAPDTAGSVVGYFWQGMLAAQIFVSWWVLRIGVPKLVLLAAGSAALLSIPLWLSTDLSVVPWLGALWGFGNLAFLKIAISYATLLQAPPSPRLVSALLFGATAGTAITPWVTSQIVAAFGTLAVLQFGSACYLLIFVLMTGVVWRTSGQVQA